MPHVEEGQLHAWLDGAYPAGDPELLAMRTHVQDCADCRNRLDEAQVVRERAGEILNLATPVVVEQPPFESLSDRQVRGRARRSYIPGPARLAWAATIVVALGAGWLARGFLPAPGAGSAVMQESAADASAAQAAEPQSTAVTAPVIADRMVEAAPPPNPPAPGVADARAGGSAARARSEAPAEAAGVRAAPPPASARDLAQTSKPVEDASLAMEAVVTAAERPLFATSRLPIINAPAPTEWQTSTLEQAQQRYGTVLHVPGLPVDNVATARSGSAVLVRLTQTLPDGAGLELLHTIPAAEAQRTDAARKVAPAAAAAQGAEAEALSGPVSDATGAWLLTIQRGNSTITVRAPIAPDSLRTLARKLR